MTSQHPQTFLAPKFNRVRVIQRSLRCFRFGLIGLIPGFGLGTAYLAFRMRQQVAQETGEHWRLGILHGTWLCVFLASILFADAKNPAGILLCVLVALPAHFFLLRRHLLNNPPGEWNPGRHLLHWGFGLAYLGGVLSLLAVVFVISILN